MSNLPRLLIATLLLSTTLTAGASSSACAQNIAVELELVLAVDTSASVDDHEYRLQMTGIAQAFRDPDVLDAIESFGESGIAVSMIHWSEAATRVTAWSHIKDRSASFRYAARIESIQRTKLGVTTAIGTALDFAEKEIAANGFVGRRRSIDVSGDGKNNSGLPLWVQRSRVILAGITINGLAILDQDPFLERYYKNHVIGGNGAFVMTAVDFRDFARAFRAKLLREIRALVSQKGPRVPEAKLARRQLQ